MQYGRIIFAIGVIALAVICIISKDFIVGRPSAWPSTFNANPALAYVSATLLIISSLGIVFQRKAFLSSLVIAVLILLLSVFRHLSHFMEDWLNTYKAIALLGGSLIIAATFCNEGKAKKYFVIVGVLSLSIFFIASGYAHFKFADFVKNFIPAYIPFHGFWAYFCGTCLFLGGIGLLIPQTAKWASLLSGIMVMGWFVLLHIPRFIADTSNASDRMGLCESFTFAGIFFALAGLLSEKNNSSVKTV